MINRGEGTREPSNNNWGQEILFCSISNIHIIDSVSSGRAELPCTSSLANFRVLIIRLAAQGACVWELKTLRFITPLTMFLFHIVQYGFI